MSETCPKCGAKDNGGSEYDCGTPFGAKVLQSDRCRIRELEQTVEAFEGMKEGAAERIADLESKLLLICAAIGDWNTHGAHTACGCAVCSELSDIARKELQ